MTGCFANGNKDQGDIQIKGGKATMFERRYVQADGIATHYLEAGDGPTLVLVHGGGPGADAEGNWQDCIEQYAKVFHVIAVDMPGFGQTERPSPDAYNYGQSGRNRHLIAFIEAIAGGRPVHLIGNSMGGATSLGVAIHRPDLVDKLVLMGAAGLDIANPDKDSRNGLTGYDYTLEGMRRLVTTLAGPNYAMPEALLRHRYELTMLAGAREATTAIHEHTLLDKMTYPPELIATIQAPTLVVGGKIDKIAVLARTYGYLDLIPNSWGFILPHVAHWAMMEAPVEFVAVTTAFLRDDMFLAPQITPAA